VTPEEESRLVIDALLLKCGWNIQNRNDIDVDAAAGVAVREFPLVEPFGEADYLLYLDARAVGIIEAKPSGWTLKGVEVQSQRYSNGLPAYVDAVRRPLPFAYEAADKEIQFTNLLEPKPRSRRVFAFHRPEELRELLELKEQSRAKLEKTSLVLVGDLWPKQVEAIRKLEESLRENKPRALVQMATGSGKTYTAVNFAYRLLRDGGAKRVLFLVDRKNLGEQTLAEFQNFRTPSNRLFPDEYGVQLLKNSTVLSSSKVVITTVQRLYSLLQGEELDESAEEVSGFEADLFAEPKQAQPVTYNGKFPIAFFDHIIIDECHRSIYNLWRQTLEYFDAFLTGLTATPTKQTVGFFDDNMVMEYTHEQAVADGVNVGFDVYRIRTKISEQGARMESEPGFFVPRRDRQTRAMRLAQLDNDLTYTANQLDRDVVARDQIRLVVQTFKNKLPKTLVFAKDDSHADDITGIIREVFGLGNDFCQKITYRITGKKPEELLREFRNDYNPRIAVSVDMIATGTDVKAIECLLFLRNVKSAGYFEQMKGRGTRVISKDDLQAVTSSAKAKTHFIIVDAVGVCEEERVESQPMERKRGVAFGKLIEGVAMGDTRADTVSSLAGRLARLDRALNEAGKAEIAKTGHSLQSIVAGMVACLKPENIEARARLNGEFGPDEAPDATQLEAAYRQLAKEALAPLRNAGTRNSILEIKTASEQVIDEVSQDELLHAGFDEVSKEKAAQIVGDFESWIEEHRDEITALQLMYAQPYRSGVRFKDLKELALKLQGSNMNAERVWQAWRFIEPERVKGRGTRPADLVALVRGVLDEGAEIVPRREEYAFFAN
jgi:type I restriction enzyme R subunit